ncbi:MAG: hypothetical protein OSB57_14835, partial [Planctomycetota bacterium]|nr:hypothetical protein [Planctomycetota bacterium]
MVETEGTEWSPDRFKRSMVAYEKSHTNLNPDNYHMAHMPNRSEPVALGFQADVRARVKSGISFMRMNHEPSGWAQKGGIERAWLRYEHERDLRVPAHIRQGLHATMWEAQPSYPLHVPSINDFRGPNRYEDYVHAARDFTMELHAAQARATEDRNRAHPGVSHYFRGLPQLIEQMRFKEGMGYLGIAAAGAGRPDVGMMLGLGGTLGQGAFQIHEINRAAEGLLEEARQYDRLPLNVYFHKGSGEFMTLTDPIEDLMEDTLHPNWDSDHQPDMLLRTMRQLENHHGPVQSRTAAMAENLTQMGRQLRTLAQAKTTNLAKDTAKELAMGLVSKLVQLSMFSRWTNQVGSWLVEQGIGPERSAQLNSAMQAIMHRQGDPNADVWATFAQQMGISEADMRVLRAKMPFHDALIFVSRSTTGDLNLLEKQGKLEKGAIDSDLYDKLTMLAAEPIKPSSIDALTKAHIIPDGSVRGEFSNFQKASKLGAHPAQLDAFKKFDAEYRTSRSQRDALMQAQIDKLANSPGPPPISGYYDSGEKELLEEVEKDLWEKSFGAEKRTQTASEMAREDAENAQDGAGILKRNADTMAKDFKKFEATQKKLNADLERAERATDARAKAAIARAAARAKKKAGKFDVPKSDPAKMERLDKIRLKKRHARKKAMAEDARRADILKKFRMDPPSPDPSPSPSPSDYGDSPDPDSEEADGFDWRRAAKYGLGLIGLAKMPDVLRWSAEAVRKDSNRKRLGLAKWTHGEMAAHYGRNATHAHAMAHMATTTNELMNVTRPATFRGYELDKTIGDTNIVVYHDPKTSQAWLAVGGNRFMGAVGAAGYRKGAPVVESFVDALKIFNLSVFSGDAVKTTPRYYQLMVFLDQYLAKYKDLGYEHIAVTGHSQGSIMLLHILEAEKKIRDGVTFATLFNTVGVTGMSQQRRFRKFVQQQKGRLALMGTEFDIIDPTHRIYIDNQAQVLGYLDNAQLQPTLEKYERMRKLGSSSWGPGGHSLSTWGDIPMPGLENEYMGGGLDSYWHDAGDPRLFLKDEVTASPYDPNADAATSILDAVGFTGFTRGVAGYAARAFESVQDAIYGDYQQPRRTTSFGQVADHVARVTRPPRP